MKKLYSCKATCGTFVICRTDESYALLLDGEPLGTYPSPEAAARALATGDGIPPALELGGCGIPPTLSGWHKLE